ncbi:MAG: hypothetical protein DRP11_01320 [Candidatus Aenigmatarchaeota archaeon]|nr:MAG: hypothetical protein DRP11_01320 [Candidatus Aenigmarchaeota archaeon]
MAVIGELSAITSNLWTSAVEFFPLLIGAIVVLIVGFIIGKAFGRIVREILIRFEVDKHLKKEGHIKFDASSVFDAVARWIVYLVAFQVAAEIMDIATLVFFVSEVVQFIVNAVMASIIVLVAYVLGIYVKDQIVSSETVYSDLAGKGLMLLIVYVGIALALPLVLKETMIVNYILLIIVGSVGLGIAIALGLGLREPVKKMFEDYAKEFRMKRK